jgi:predicted GTPase
MRGLGAYWREALLLALVVLPLGALPVLGFLWLAQQGLALAWFLGLLLLAALAMLLRSLWARGLHGVAAAPPGPAAPTAEREARAALDALLTEVGAADIASAEATRRLTERVVGAVAEAFHPGDPNAALRVTLPEVLLMTERFAASLRARMLVELPILARAELTLVPQGLSLSQAGGRLWDAWRVVRLADPLGALLQEARAVLINAALSRLGETARDRVAALLAREIGEVAIDLYAGRFRKAAAELAATAPRLTPEAAPGPVTVLLGGQRNAGKSSLINALSGTLRVPASLTRQSADFTAHALGEDLVLVDGPGTGAEPSRAWLDRAAEADAILWVARAHDIARGPDQRALAALRGAQAARRAETAAPVILVLTHADRLPPPRDWAPPYDLQGEAAKEQSFRAALGAARAALDIDRAVILRCDSVADAWNLDALRAALAAALPAARARQLDRAFAPAGWAGLAAGTLVRLPGLARRLWSAGEGGRRRN